MNLNELKVERYYDHVLPAEALVKAAKASGKDLQGAELEQYDAHLVRIKEIDALVAKNEAQIDRTLNPGSPFGGEAISGASEWTDPRSGQPIRVLRPDQPMNSYVGFGGYEEPLSLGKYLRGIVTGRWNNAEREMRAMSEGSLGGGGYLLPAPLSDRVIDRVRNAAVMLKAGAMTVPMESNTLSIARVAASNGDVTPAWHTEAAAITASDMTFERVTFTAQTLAAIAMMSVELFEDAPNLDVIVTDAIGKVLAIELDRACLRGSGTAPEPRGLRNQTGVTVDSTTFGASGSAISTTTPTGAVAWDWLAKQVSGLWSVNENPNSAIYSARTAGELDLLRATTGEVLPPPGSVSKLQLLYTNSIPNNLTVGSNSDCSEAYLGDFSQALIGLRHGIVLEFARQANVGSTSLFSTLQVAIRAYLRADFQLARPGAFRVVTGIR